MELAPVLGLADAIVDIVETGTTLKEKRAGGPGRYLSCKRPVNCKHCQYEIKKSRDRGVHSKKVEADVKKQGIERAWKDVQNTRAV